MLASVNFLFAALLATNCLDILCASGENGGCVLFPSNTVVPRRLHPLHPRPRHSQQVHQLVLLQLGTQRYLAVTTMAVKDDYHCLTRGVEYQPRYDK